jgi:guanyl-specific ribonuclease Sa
MIGRLVRIGGVVLVLLGVLTVCWARFLDDDYESSSDARVGAELLQLYFPAAEVVEGRGEAQVIVDVTGDQCITDMVQFDAVPNLEVTGNTTCEVIEWNGPFKDRDCQVIMILHRSRSVTARAWCYYETRAERTTGSLPG